MSTKSEYRADIDGLRAVAVIVVIMNHVGLSIFSGGFVGVDVFFVISGFFITRIIVNEIEATGAFSFARFYSRRARRLFPAALSTILLSFAFAYLLFPAALFSDFLGSSIYALTSISNFFFWWTSGYFDAESVTKPLLHTWSLAVEEQFYLIWPVLAVVLLTKAPRFSAVAFLGLIALASLAIGQYWLSNDMAMAAYYLLPGRAMELGIGGLMVWIVRRQPPAALSFMKEPLLLVGLALIAYTALTYDETTPFPGIAALLPCLGAAIVIYAGDTRWLGMLLRNPIAVWIGKASYSIYLLHWPLIVFTTYFVYQPLSAEQKWTLVAVAIGLGFAQYFLIEERFRHEQKARVSRAAFGLICAFLTCLALVPTASLWQEGGATWRVPADRAFRSAAQWYTLGKEQYCSTPNPAFPANIVTCQNYVGSEKSLFVWGDSHAEHLAAGLANAYPHINIYILFGGDCQPQVGFLGYMRAASASFNERCSQRNEKALEFLKVQNPSNIILASAKRSTPNLVAPPTIWLTEQLQAEGHNVLVLGDFIRPGVDLAACFSAPAYLLTDDINRQRCAGVASIQNAELEFNDKMEALVPGFLNPNSAQCPDAKCVVARGNTPLFRDSHHLTTQGSRAFIALIKSRLTKFIKQMDDPA
ncbi:acyltransferase family protein [Devosia sp. 2618]|uniref:acyltransferase family protein n=1 Tax=Devosia sp. 2618 TaxID=3156454 RepID=UPI003394F180